MTPEELKKAQEDLGLGNELFAAYLGVDASTLWRWLKGHRTIPNTVRAVTKAWLALQDVVAADSLHEAVTIAEDALPIGV